MLWIDFWLGSLVLNNCYEKYYTFLNHNSLFVKGKPGTGKSSLLRILSRKLQNHPHVKFVAWINCKNIKGKTMDSLLKVFLNTFSELVLHQPSILMLDDLNVLCERSKGEETAPNNIYFDR